MGILSRIIDFFRGKPEKVEIEIEPIEREPLVEIPPWWFREPEIEEEIIEEAPPVIEEIEELPEKEELEEVPEFVGIYRYTYGIMFVEHHQYYSIIVQGWSDIEGDTDIEDKAKDEANRLLQQTLDTKKYDLDLWFDEGLAVTEGVTWEEMPYDRSLENKIGTIEGRVEFKHGGTRWQRWGTWKDLAQQKLSDLL